MPVKPAESKGNIRLDDPTLHNRIIVYNRFGTSVLDCAAASGESWPCIGFWRCNLHTDYWCRCIDDTCLPAHGRAIVYTRVISFIDCDEIRKQNEY